MRVADYEITIDGALTGSHAAAFEPHHITVNGATSTITALQIDQAALFAILTRARDLAVSVARVERLTPV